MVTATSQDRPKVLFVEDEKLVSTLMSEVLDEQGFAVHAVDNAEAALRYLQSGADVDVLFTDINMPGDIDGAALAVEARNLRPDLPVVYASGRMTPSQLNPLVPRAMFLAKPYDPIEACTLLSRLAPRAAA
jgi:CheY-like chemotaxis protein